MRRSIEWAFLFALSGMGIALASWVGFGTGLAQSLPGILVVLALSLAGMACTKLIPLKLPIVAYVSILGLAVACPLSPVRDFVIAAVAQIELTAPLALVGAFAGIGVADQLGFFARQGWKMIVVGIVFMTGSFVITAIISQVLLTLTGAI